MLGIIRKSPSRRIKLFDILAKQANTNCEAATQLRDLMAYFRRLNLFIGNENEFSDEEHRLIIRIVNQRELSHIVRNIRDLDQEAYQLFREFVSVLNRTLVTPIDSDDLYRCSREIKSIIGHIYSAAFRINLYAAKWPDKFCYRLVDLFLDMTEESRVTISILKTMGEARPHLERMLILERKARKVYIRGMKALLETEDEKELLKWHDIYTELRKAIKCCVSISERIEYIKVKYA